MLSGWEDMVKVETRRATLAMILSTGRGTLKMSSHATMGNAGQREFDQEAGDGLSPRARYPLTGLGHGNVTSSMVVARNVETCRACQRSIYSIRLSRANPANHQLAIEREGIR